jgi:hypothetical protein
VRVCENRGKVEFGVGGKNWLPCYVTPERFVSQIATSYNLTCACKKAVGGFIGSGMGIRSASRYRPELSGSNAMCSRSVSSAQQKGPWIAPGVWQLVGGVPHGVHAC